MSGVTPVDTSGGCECDYCCVLNGQDGTCSGRLWWKCDCPNGTLVLQRSNGSSWANVSADLSTGSYTVPASGTFRLRCTLTTGEVYFSNQVTVTVCTNHSVWFRWHKQNTSSTVNLAIGCTYEEVGSPPVRRVRSNLNGFTYAVSGGTFMSPSGPGLNGLWVVYPDSFPTPYGCAAPSSTPIVGDVKLYSYVNTSTQTRTGYTFDYRQLYGVTAPGCGTGQSIGYFFPTRGLIDLGHVTITDRLQISFSEVATIPAQWFSGSVTALDQMSGNSGPNFASDDTGTHDADVKLWLPPFDVFPIVWHDGASTPSLPFDPTGNSIGLVLENRTTSASVTGTKMSKCGVRLNVYDFVSLATNSVFSFERRRFNWAATEVNIRTCAQANAGTNVLPPSSVNPNDPCDIFSFAFPLTAGNACLP
jgi:hypothetical protein